MNTNEFNHLNFIVPPENQGQIIEISFAIDGENEQVICREFDASDRTTCYSCTPIDNIQGEYRPYYTRPSFKDNGLFTAIEE
jgi:hypothetical protein